MPTNKTTETNADVTDFIHRFASTGQQRIDSFALIRLIQDITGFEPKMCGSGIIGFGSYHYKYPSGHEGMHRLWDFCTARPPFPCMYLPVRRSINNCWVASVFNRGKACLYTDLPPSGAL